jgi:hypothetical protein
MSELRAQQSAAEEELETLRRAVTETQLSVLRSQMNERFHLDNVQIESYVRNRERFAVLAFLVGCGSGSTEVTTAKGYVWTFAPADSAHSADTERELVYGYAEEELEISLPLLDARLRGFLLPDGSEESMDEMLREVLQFDGTLTRLATPREPAERFFPCPPEKEVLLVLRDRLLKGERHLRETNRIPLHRMGCVTGTWSLRAREPIAWLCSLDELRGLLVRGAARGEIEIMSRIESLRQRCLRGSLEIVQLQRLFFLRWESSVT